VLIIATFEAGLALPVQCNSDFLPTGPFIIVLYAATLIQGVVLVALLVKRWKRPGNGVKNGPIVGSSEFVVSVIIATVVFFLGAALAFGLPLHGICGI